MSKRFQEGGFKRHPLSAAWGDMPENELLALAEDIKRHGQKDTVIMHEGMVLDGWHRCQACQIAGVAVRIMDFPDDGDPWSYVRSKNDFRRHSSASMRAAAALKYNELRPAGNPNFAPAPKSENPSKNAGSAYVATLPNREPDDKDLASLAKEARVSQRTMVDAHAAKKAGLLDDVANGTKSASKAAKEARGTTEKKPTPLEKAQARIKELEAILAEREQVIRDLREALESDDDSRASDAEQKAKFEQLRAEKRALESQLAEKTALVNQWQREAKGLRKKLGIKV